MLDDLLSFIPDLINSVTSMLFGLIEEFEAQIISDLNILYGELDSLQNNVLSGLTQIKPFLQLSAEIVPYGYLADLFAAYLTIMIILAIVKWVLVFVPTIF